MELYENIYKNNFSFWKNWQNFLKKLDNEKINQAKNYLAKFIWWEDKIKGKTVIDFGSWSWLMSLSFYLLWAEKVVSVDIDENSINCTKYLRENFLNKWNWNWEIIHGSVLDEEFVKSLWSFDIVYSWWVIHHTWDMWKWLNNILNLTKENSLIYTAIYNDSKILLEWTSPFWVKFKKFYSWSKFLRYIIKPLYTAYLIAWITAKWNNPFKYIKNYEKTAFRWMDFFVDIEDWLWGYPYEYASFNEIKKFYESKWFKLINWLEVRSIWCNEFLFQK